MQGKWREDKVRGAFTGWASDQLAFMGEICHITSWKLMMKVLKVLWLFYGTMTLFLYYNSLMVPWIVVLWPCYGTLTLSYSTKDSLVVPWVFHSWLSYATYHSLQAYMSNKKINDIYVPTKRNPTKYMPYQIKFHNKKPTKCWSTKKIRQKRWQSTQPTNGKCINHSRL